MAKKTLDDLMGELAELEAKQKADLAKKKAAIARAQRYEDEKLGRRIRETGATSKQIDMFIEKLAAAIAAEAAKKAAEQKAAEVEKTDGKAEEKPVGPAPAKPVEKVPAKPEPKPAEGKPAAPKPSVFGPAFH